MVEFELPDHLTHEELGYLSRQAVHSLLRTAQEDDLPVKVYATPLVDELLVQLFSRRIEIRGVEIGRED